MSYTKFELGQMIGGGKRWLWLCAQIAKSFLRHFPAMILAITNYNDWKQLISEMMMRILVLMQTINDSIMDLILLKRYSWFVSLSNVIVIANFWLRTMNRKVSDLRCIEMTLSIACLVRVLSPWMLVIDANHRLWSSGLIVWRELSIVLVSLVTRTQRSIAVMSNVTIAELKAQLFMNLWPKFYILPVILLYSKKLVQ